jgi:hypothetical protein
MIVYDARTHSLNRHEIPGGPAHIEWDPVDPEMFYICSNNLAINNDSLYCFGPSRIDAYRLKNGEAIWQAKYQSEDFLRAPGHRITRFKGQSLMLLPVHPNQVHILDLEKMSLCKKIWVPGAERQKATLADGPFAYPPALRDKTPYSVEAEDGTPYLFLSNVSALRVVDLETANELDSIIYNGGKAGGFLGHAAKFMLRNSE